jgi:hypothetical protein
VGKYKAGTLFDAIVFLENGKYQALALAHSQSLQNFQLKHWTNEIGKTTLKYRGVKSKVYYCFCHPFLLKTSKATTSEALTGRRIIVLPPIPSGCSNT